MATTIKKPSSQFDIVTYTGDGASTKTITGLGFQPDFIWTKRRTGASDHNLQDSLRGFGSTTKLASSSTYGENNTDGLYTDPKWGYISAATSDGYTITKNTNGDHVNYSSAPYVAWCWKSSSSSVTNTDGTLTSQVRANQAAGFSVVTYAGVDSPSTNTVGHGLGSAPKLWIIKNRTTASPQGWVVNTTVVDGSVDYLFLNTTAAKGDQGSPWSTAPTSSVFTLGANDGNTCDAGSNYVAYCWTEISGYSKIGSYTGNGSSNGPFIYTGFKPKFVMLKKTNDIGSWIIFDTSRSPFNPMPAIGGFLFANISDAESGTGDSAAYVDFVSNGFKIRNASDFDNTSSGTYIYMAFAESPVKYTNAR